MTFTVVFIFCISTYNVPNALRSTMYVCTTYMFPVPMFIFYRRQYGSDGIQVIYSPTISLLLFSVGTLVLFNFENEKSVNN